MPEGDVVRRTARRLDAGLAGQRLLAAELRWPSLATADLTGATVLEVVSRGKHLLHRFDDGRTLHSHLRMEGQWRLERTGSEADRRYERHPQVRAMLRTEAWTAYGLRLGMLDLVPTREEGTLVGHLGPDLLGPDWDAGVAVANLVRATQGGTVLGTALLDQRNLAGLGTVWTAEPLHAEGVGPWTTPGEETVARVVARAHRLLSTAADHDVPLRVYGRSGRPCPRCGDLVRVAPIGVAPTDRVLFYCPTCQGGLAPTDDGRPQAPLGASAREPGRRTTERDRRPRSR